VSLALQYHADLGHLRDPVLTMLQGSSRVEAASEHVRLSDVLPPVLACASSLPEWLTNRTGIPTPELTQCATKLTVGNQITLVAIDQHDGFMSSSVAK
jgi:hypothetical protein